MYISKVNIHNFKCFKGKFSIALNRGANILVGDNEAGKSTIIEAIHLALSGVLHGRYLKNELSQYLFNIEVERDYLKSVVQGEYLTPPRILIEVFLESENEIPEFAELEGDDNSEKSSSSGISYSIEFDDQYASQYSELIKQKQINTLPIEYYKVVWTSFARDPISSRTLPLKSALIDSSSTRTSNGSDLYIARIIRENLEDKERVEISQAHRQMKETFMNASSVKAINGKVNSESKISTKEIKISVDLSTQHAWEASLMTYLDDVPFHYIGKGEQSVVKTSLALSHRKSREANVLLLEEPENHLSHANLNRLLSGILTGLSHKQVIVSTHSSFVANKLGLDNLVLLNDRTCSKMKDLAPDTKNFFMKLSGYDTLRMILCNSAILVEGDSDELVVQKAYQAKHGKLPIENGIEVISVGTSFLRFLEVAEKINKKVAVATDNDGNLEALKKKYKDFLGDSSKSHIKICFDPTVHPQGTNSDLNYNTLEPNILRMNSRDKLNAVLGKNYSSDEDLIKFMSENKTACALSIFESNEAISFPQYILDAIDAF